VGGKCEKWTGLSSAAAQQLTASSVTTSAPQQIGNFSNTECGITMDSPDHVTLITGTEILVYSGRNNFAQ
jgi:hypothetical protein